MQHFLMQTGIYTQKNVAMHENGHFYQVPFGIRPLVAVQFFMIQVFFVHHFHYQIIFSLMMITLLLPREMIHQRHGIIKDGGAIQVVMHIAILQVNLLATFHFL